MFRQALIVLALSVLFGAAVQAQQKAEPTDYLMVKKDYLAALEKQHNVAVARSQYIQAALIGLLSNKNIDPRDVEANTKLATTYAVVLSKDAEEQKK